MLKKVTNEFFGRPKGLIIDNSYDPYVLHSLIKYYKEEKIEFLHSQDNDLSYLKCFENIKFLSINNESENFTELNNLKNLKGLRLFSSSLKNIEREIIEKLEFLEIIFDDNTTVDFSMFKSLKHLCINHFPFTKPNIINGLQTLEFSDCKKIISLNFLESINSIKKIKLSNLPKLQDVNCLKRISDSLEIIDILDCKKINNIDEVLEILINLRYVQIITIATDSKMKLSSLSFIDSLPKLESFATNYKIEDGNLNWLLRLKDANITAFYRNYNLRDKDLPHISVPLDNNGVVKRVRLDSLELGKKDKRIIWLN